MSVSSRAAVNTVEELKSRLGHMEERLRQASKVASSERSTVEELLEVKQELAQMVGTLEKFQFNEVDAVVTHNLNSGKDEVRRQRRALTDTVTALGEEAARMHKAIAARIGAVTAAP